MADALAAMLRDADEEVLLESALRRFRRRENAEAFMANLRATSCAAVMARIGQSGRCLEISREVNPVSVRLTMAVAPS